MNSKPASFKSAFDRSSRIIETFGVPKFNYLNCKCGPICKCGPNCQCGLGCQCANHLQLCSQNPQMACNHLNSKCSCPPNTNCTCYKKIKNLYTFNQLGGIF